MEIEPVGYSLMGETPLAVDFDLLTRDITLVRHVANHLMHNLWVEISQGGQPVDHIRPLDLVATSKFLKRHLSGPMVL